MKKINHEKYLMYVILERNLTLFIALFFLCGFLFHGFLLCNFLVNRSYETKKYEFVTEKTSSEIRIIQVSDLHCSSYGENNESLIEDIKSKQPDIIVLTGDIVNSRDKATEVPISFLRACVKIAPTFYVYGNNEVRSTKGEKEGEDIFGYTKDELPDLNYMRYGLGIVGITVLQNEMVTIKVRDTYVDIFGILTSNSDSFGEYVWEDFREFTENNPDHVKVTLCHEPYVYEEYGIENYMGDVCFSGHTHGGEIRIPVIGPVYEKKHGIFPGNDFFIYGKHELCNGILICSSGLINRDFLRIFNKPEMIVVDIVAEAA